MGTSSSSTSAGEIHDSPTETDLITSVCTENWNVARAILKRKKTREGLEYTDQRGWNVLHWACVGDDTPIDVLQGILDVVSNAPMTQDGFGYTPLTVAIKSSTDEVIMIMIKACPAAVFLLDRWGQTSLYWAMACNRSNVIIQKLLLIYPSAINVCCNEGRTPLHVLCSQWTVGIQNIKCNRQYEHDVSAFLESYIEAEFGERRKIQQVYETLLLAIESSIYGKIFGSQTFNVLHSAIIIPNFSCDIFELLVKIGSEDLSKTDEKGNTPLHVAVMTKGPTICAIIEILLRYKPEQAKILNNEGRLPLNIAIENEKTCRRGILTEPALMLLVNAAPQALITRDIKTHLLPFMTAATAALQRYSSNKATETDDILALDQLNKIYRLLKEDPSAMLHN